MAIKYIQKHKDGNWGISNSKTGKAIKNAKTEKEALAIAGTYKNVEGVMILRKGTWKKATGWDMELVNVTKAPKKAVAKKKTTAKKPAAKKAVAKKAVAKKPVAKKTAVKKPKPELTIIDMRYKNNEDDKSTSKKAPSKPVAKKETTNNDIMTSKKNGLPGWAGFIVGFAIIFVVIGSAFLIGYYIK